MQFCHLLAGLQAKDTRFDAHATDSSTRPAIQMFGAHGNLLNDETMDGSPLCPCTALVKDTDGDKDESILVPAPRDDACLQGN
jgi:hypothetical protein